MTAAKKAASPKGEAAPVADVPTTASPESPAPPLVASYDQLTEVAKESAPADNSKKKKG